MYKAHVLRSVRKDIREAALWYNEQLPGLGRRFTHFTRKKIELICENPHLYTIRYAEMRTAILPVFPFMIHFKIDEKRRVVAIVGVFHTSLDPEKWRSR